MLTTFLDDVRDPHGGEISPRRMSDALRMPLNELARIVHMHRNTLTRKPYSPRVQGRLGEIARIIAFAAELTGDSGRAIVWFRHQPLAGFDYKTAEQLVEAGQAPAVLKHLEMLRDGVYA